ncbi:two-component system phosphate regulon sensor histidine kinase PhoR [Psychrobacter sp. PL19]|uniref:phosphate regulon sensor histidine kinase PhoR n=1 Tax=Psychrobacter sp. PL19 TaxID=2760711 RepID=UPI002FF116C9
MMTPADNKTQPAPRYALLWADICWLLFWLSSGVALGLYTSYLLESVIVALLLYSLWRMYSLHRFNAWINKPVNTPSPEMLGGLSVIASQLYQKRKQEKFTQQKLMGLVKKIRSSLLALQDAVILLNDTDGLEWWNQAAEDLLVLQSSDQGNSIFNLITVPEFRQYYQTTAAPNNGIHLVSWKNPERYLKCEVTHFGGEKLLIIYDVTRLQHLEQMRRDFVANVSHELRTPLTVLMGYLETFSDQADIAPQWQRGFKLMTQQTARMNSIVNDLLLLSRLENEEKPALSMIDMSRLLTQLFDDAKVYNKEYEHQISLQVNTDSNLYGAELYLNSALSNLVVNAIKYTPKGGNIIISWTATAQGCSFAVTDDGIGIAPQHIARLTERFYRVDSGRSRATGGTGLGLAIVKHVLYQHQASLNIESNEGQGSIFSILFMPASICAPDTDVATITTKNSDSADTRVSTDSTNNVDSINNISSNDLKNSEKT